MTCDQKPDQSSALRILKMGIHETLQCERRHMQRPSILMAHSMQSTGRSSTLLGIRFNDHIIYHAAHVLDPSLQIIEDDSESDQSEELDFVEPVHYQAPHMTTT